MYRVPEGVFAAGSALQRHTVNSAKVANAFRAGPVPDGGGVSRLTLDEAVGGGRSNVSRTGVLQRETREHLTS